MDWVAFASHLATFAVGILAGVLTVLFLCVRGLTKALGERQAGGGKHERHIP